MTKRNYKLALIMSERGFTQKRLADATGIGKNSIWKYVHGRMPRVDRAIRIASVLEATTEEIWGDSNDVPA